MDLSLRKIIIFVDIIPLILRKEGNSSNSDFDHEINKTWQKINPIKN
jgi:hypothetical protein